MEVRVIRLFPILSVVAFAAGLDFNAIPRPPLPPDPLELVTGDAQPVQDAQQRIAAIGLLDKAHRLSNVRAQPYALRTSFTASEYVDSRTRIGSGSPNTLQIPSGVSCDYAAFLWRAGVGTSMTTG